MEVDFLRKYGTIKEEKKKVTLEASINEEELDAEVGFSVEVDQEELKKGIEELTLATTKKSKIDYNEDWIIDFGCSNHMTSDEKKLQNMTEYKGRRVVLTANNSKLSISHIGKTTIPRYGSR